MVVIWRQWMICLTSVHVFVWKFMLFDCHEFNWKMIFNKKNKNNYQRYVGGMYVSYYYLLLLYSCKWTLQSLIDNCCNFTNVHWFQKALGCCCYWNIYSIIHWNIFMLLFVYKFLCHGLLKARCFKICSYAQENWEFWDVYNLI